MSSSSSYKEEEEDDRSFASSEEPIDERPAESLERIALRGVLEGLHELTSSKACSFAGSGSVAVSDPVRVSVSALSGDPPPFAVSFPGTQDLSPLIKACSSASFGKGPLQVYDQSYRSALELIPMEFTTSFSLAEYDILPEIARLTNTDGASLTAKLYKLNVYRPGDFFKSHLDTPRDGLIGSLVVCLPHEHTGGTLKVPKKALSSSRNIHWVNGNFEFQAALVTQAYGNEWSIDAKYSAAAIFVTVAPWNKRFS
ncbi:hypothetical protein WJX73_007372 [Symbiochloris irregularis]|uniref:Uncharacterized protein n=1 Tax=Symbiochloris irregularis TaxID=706552 RepID=A0AAW1NQN0_9CHLO